MSSERPPRDPILREAMTKAAKPEPAARPFVHLRVHSAYSLLEGALPVKKIVGHAVKDAAPAIADHRHQQSLRRARIRAICGEGRHPAADRLPDRRRLRRREPGRQPRLPEAAGSGTLSRWC